MSKNTAVLNLARLWRPRTFKEVVGQPLVVQLLTNGLKRGILFPVYLLAGLRGSGKTSVGRIFACAVNCSLRLDYASGAYTGEFPCLSCSSCQAMIAGEHPDFIEIDAASHTGVDHVRQLIEEASFLPVMGEKKLYLIDEAHMLSKAAFNAFLKILEEPPKTVLFLLATTDVHKVLETVRSRSFQLFFDPIPSTDLIKHLQRVCELEKISYEPAGLACIAQVSGGSVRDALNLLERVRLLSQDGATQKVLSHLLGTINDEVFCELFEAVARGSCAEVLDKLYRLKISESPAMPIWERLLMLIRELIWVQQGLSTKHFLHINESIKKLSVLFSLSQLLEFLDMFYRFELQFTKTAAQHILIERLLCGMTLKCGDFDEAKINKKEERGEAQKPILHKKSEIAQAPVDTKIKQSLTKTDDPLQKWQLFIKIREDDGDPIVISILKQVSCIEVVASVVKVVLPQKFVFYKDLLFKNQALWQASLEKCFGDGMSLTFDFSAGVDEEKKPPKATNAESFLAERDESGPVGRAPHIQTWGPVARTISESPKKFVDVSDTVKFKRAQELLGLFPGTITEVKENHE